MHDAPDMNQGIHRMISCQPTPQTNVNVDTMHSCESIVGTYTNQQTDNAYRNSMLNTRPSIHASSIESVTNQYYANLDHRHVSFYQIRDDIAIHNAQTTEQCSLSASANVIIPSVTWHPGRVNCLDRNVLFRILCCWRSRWRVCWPTYWLSTAAHDQPGMSCNFWQVNQVRNY